ncbi:hypothetical protein GCM10009836_18660 [Pseudonocardia ailaonensis]|uniref:Uncharacterized protein n=1 Tax=Pseudonocardia ailaonensis TaxID=367279 RepID=A0ABN2MVJ9_9PSEU
MREWAGVGREESDEEIVETDMGGEDQLALPAETWEAIRDDVADLLDAAEIGGVEAAEKWLQSRGLKYSRCSSEGGLSARTAGRTRVERIDRR